VSKPFDIRKEDLDQRYLVILAAAREHFGTDKARRGALREWYQEAYGKKPGAEYAYVPNQIIKNGYLQAGRGWYWLDPDKMNESPASDEGQGDLSDGLGGSATVDEEVDAAFDAAFTLERDLERSLVANLGQLDSGLKLYTRDGCRGQQFRTEVGIIDVLAVGASNELLVIELKAGRAEDRVVAQILRYMGWVEKRLAEPTQTVRGMIVANDFSDGLKYAVAAVPAIELKQYEVNFKFTDVSL